MVKSYIKDTKELLKKFAPRFLFIIDFVGLYPNIPYGDGLVALRKSLDFEEHFKF